MPPQDRKPADFNRREFLGNSARQAAGVAAGVIGLGMSAPQRPGSPNDTISVGIVGAGQQGRLLSQELCQIPGMRVAALCDVDPLALASAQHEVHDLTGHRPALLTKHESLLERPDIDAIVIATPDHWHARIAIEACRAGKDLYLEQPIAHSIAEGEAILRAAQKSQRIVQTGLPQRSGAHFQSAIALLQSGEIGAVHLAKAWAVHRRRSIGRTAAATVPPGVDYARWLGPALPRPFQSSRYHQSWPWFWDYGSGELGLWGVQLLDVVRWGLNLDLPQRVAALGGRRVFHDDRETPDTLSVQFAFPDVDVTWEHRQWSGRGIEGRTAAVAFYGERGTLIVDRSGWKVYDGPEGLYADTSDFRREHLRNWADCLRTRRPPAADLLTGQRSMVMCHLGNIAFRLGRELQFDPHSLTCPGNAEATALIAHAPPEYWPFLEGECPPKS